MKIVKFNFTIENIIEANIGLQTIQSILKVKYNIFRPSVGLLTSDKFINVYRNWDSEKKDGFVRTVAGRANFKKAKLFYESKSEKNS